MNTVFQVGLALGALSSGSLTRFGKKNCIHATNILVFIGCSLLLVKELYVIYVGRFLFGLAGGAFSVFVKKIIFHIVFYYFT